MGKYDNFNMCPASTLCDLASIFEQLEDGTYEGDNLTEAQINSLNNMCQGYSDLQFGTLLDDIITASKSSKSVPALTSEQKEIIANLNCPVASSYDMVTLLNNIISNVNGNVPSTDATLKSLEVAGQTLEPAFGSGVLNYTVNVANGVTSVTINAEANDSNAEVTGTGAHNVNVGNNTLNVVVTAEDGETTRTYVIKVVRAKSTDATLKSLSVAGQTLEPTFNSNTLNYTVNVANSVTSVTINAEANSDVASVAGTGVKSVNVGDNSFDIDVTAQDGTTKKTYVVKVVRAKSSDATLKSLSIEGQTIEPTFSSEVINYTATVENTVANINILAEANSSVAQVTGTGNKALTEGSNTCEVVVTAEDGSTTKTYTISVTRQSAEA